MTKFILNRPDDRRIYSRRKVIGITLKWFALLVFCAPLWEGAPIYGVGDPLNNIQDNVLLTPPGKKIYVPTDSYKPSHGIDWFQNVTLPDYE